MAISVNQNRHCEEMGAWLQILQIAGNNMPNPRSNKQIESKFQEPFWKYIEHKNALTNALELLFQDSNVFQIFNLDFFKVYFS